MTYQELKNLQPEMNECFWAFSDKQFAEGRKVIPDGEKIYSAGSGLYGTKKGLHEFDAFYDNTIKRMGEECNPQDVYRYEFDNHECSYTGDDSEAYQIVLDIFGEEKSQTVKRRYN